MNDQIIILFFLIFTFVGTMFLYLWKAKKQYNYKNDERWQVIQNKANGSANCLNCILVVLIAIGSTIPFFHEIKLTFTFSRVITYSLIYFGIRNIVEFFALLYFDKKI